MLLIDQEKAQYGRVFLELDEAQNKTVKKLEQFNISLS